MSKYKIILSYFFGIVIIGIFVWRYNQHKNEMQILEKNGEITKGVITDVSRRRKGTLFKYKYYINGKKYESGDKTHNYIQQGDTINIVYYPFNPKIHKLTINEN